VGAGVVAQTPGLTVAIAPIDAAHQSRDGHKDMRALSTFRVRVPSKGGIDKNVPGGAG